MDDLDLLLAKQAAGLQPQAPTQQPAQTRQIDPIDAALAAQSVSKTQQQQQPVAQTQQSGGLPYTYPARAGLEFLDAAQHHFMGTLHSVPQLIANAGAYVYNKTLPDPDLEEKPTFSGSLRRVMNELAGYENKRAQDREAEYQARVPDSAPSYTGAVVGTVLGGGRTIPATSAAVEGLGAKLVQQLPSTAKVVTPASKLAGAATAGAVGGAMTPVTEDGDYWDQKQKQVATGATLGAGLKLLQPTAVKMATSVANRFGWIPQSAADSERALIDDINKVNAQNQPTQQPVVKPRVVPQGQGTFKVVTPESDSTQLAKVNNRGIASPQDFETAGMTGQASPTAAQTLRDAGLWTTEQNMAKANTGGPLNQKYVAQNDAIQNAIAKIKEGTGGTAKDAPQAGETASDAILSKWRESQEKIGNLYKEIQNSDAANKTVVPSKLTDALSEHADISGADALTGTVLRRMKKFELIEPDSLKFDPANGWQFKLKDGAQLNVNQAEELRKVINNAASSRTEKMTAGKLIDALDNDVIDNTGIDAFKTARDAARQRFQEFYPTGEGYQPTVVGKIVDGKIAPDNLLGNVLVKGKVADVLALKNSLLSGTPEQIQRGQGAWNDLRGQIVDHLLSSSVSNTTGKFSPKTFANELDKIGTNLNHIFTPQELAALASIKRAGNAAFADVPFSAVNHSNTGPYMENLLKQSGMSKAGELTGNLLSQLPVVGGVGEKLAEKSAQAGQKSVEQNLANFNPAVMARMTQNENVRKALNALPLSEYTATMLVRHQKGSANQNNSQ